MKELLMLYAKYNLETSKKIVEMISVLGEDDLTKDRNCYYGSIKELCKHLFSGSWHYINAIIQISEEKYRVDLPDLTAVMRLFEENHHEAFQYYMNVSLLFMTLIEKIDKDDFFLEQKNMKIYNGRIVNMTIWNYFLQHITHQTHHQGQLSNILDELKLEHEFGNIFPFIPDSL